MFARIIITMQVPQTLGASKSQTKIILDVGGFHLTPNMTIALAVHALHLSRLANWNTDGQQFKDDVIVKCHKQKGNILDFDFLIVQ